MEIDALGAADAGAASDTGSAAEPHVVVHLKPTLAKLTTPHGSGVGGRFGVRLCSFIRRSGLGCGRQREGLPRLDSGLLHELGLRSHPARA